MHIPLVHTTNSSALIEILEGRGNVLALTGHMHQVERNFLHGQDVCVHELVTGASCGFWWVGEKDWEGIPSALSNVVLLVIILFLILQRKTILSGIRA